MIFLNFIQLHFNKPISIWLNNLTDNIIIKKLVYIFSDAPIFILPIFLIWFWIYYTYKQNKDKKNNLLFIFYWVCLSILISLIIQNFIHIDRPEESLRAAWKMILNHIPDASFPSDHASVSWAFLAWLMLFWYKKISYFFLPLSLIMLLSRIAWWVHWASDIIVWLIIWILSSIFIYKFQNINILKKTYMFILKISSYTKL